MNFEQKTHHFESNVSLFRFSAPLDEMKNIFSTFSTAVRHLEKSSNGNSFTSLIDSIFFERPFAPWILKIAPNSTFWPSDTQLYENHQTASISTHLRLIEIYWQLSGESLNRFQKSENKKLPSFGFITSQFRIIFQLFFFGICNLYLRIYWQPNCNHWTGSKNLQESSKLLKYVGKALIYDNSDTLRMISAILGVRIESKVQNLSNRTRTRMR